MKAISAEQLRILVAAAEGRLSLNARSFRYEIEGEDPPNRWERQKLQKRGLLGRPSRGGRILTEQGKEALVSAPLAASPPPQMELASPPSREMKR